MHNNPTLAELPTVPLSSPPSPASNGEGRCHHACGPLARDGGDSRVLELDPNRVYTPDGNRTVTPESVSRLVDNLRDLGQLVTGIVAPHLDADKPECWLCLDGNRRLLACRILGIKFKAVEHRGPVTPGALAVTRLAIDRQHKKMTDDQVAADLERIMEEYGCNQAEAAQKCGLSASEASKALKYQERAIPEVKQAVAEKCLVRDAARAISTVPPEKQKELLGRTLRSNLKTHVVEVLAAELRGKQPRKPKPVKVMLPGLTLILAIDDLQKIFGTLGLVDSALRKLEKHALPLASLPSLLRS